MKLLVDGVEVTVRLAGDVAHVEIGGVEHTVAVVRTPAGAWRVDGAPAWAAGGRAGVGLDAATVRVAARPGTAAPGTLSPPIPCTVLRVLVAVGDAVEPGQPLVVLGAMKTEVVLRAPHAGRIRAVHAVVGATAAPGVALVVLDPADGPG